MVFETNILTKKPGDQSPRIAYLLSQYPAISHTFFLNEVQAMRERGYAIETASVNTIHPPSGGFPPTEMKEAQQTFYIKATPRSRILSILLETLFRRPGVLFRGLAAALKLQPGNIPGTGYALFYLLEAILVGDWMQRKQCRHLHVHFGGSVATVGMLTSIAWRLPYSLTVHGPEEFYDVGPSFLEQKIRLATFVTCISFYCRSQLLKISPISGWSKFHVCRLGVQTDVFAPADAAEREVMHVMSVGRLHPAKGQMMLLQAFAELLHRGLRVRLSIVGDGAGVEALRAFIESHRLSEAVTLHGALSHPATRALLATADLFVLPSFAEGVPVALMEAMSMEVACISTFVAGIPELIETEVQGILVPPSSEQALTEAMALLISDRPRREVLAAAGRRKVIASYNLYPNIGRLIQVFEQYGLARQTP